MSARSESSRFFLASSGRLRIFSAQLRSDFFFSDSDFGCWFAAAVESFCVVICDAMRCGVRNKELYLFSRKLRNNKLSIRLEEEEDEAATERKKC